ncbi:MAG: hypothetical protein E7665_00435 [Ruminococcaceae bacterium]|nr:hypothetical protein [Oscillospiraceae bacterium]
MEFRFNTDFDIMDRCGNIVIMYLKEDREEVAELIKVLDTMGYVYVCREIGKSIIGQRDFSEDVRSMMKNCSCLIAVLNKAFERKKKADNGGALDSAPDHDDNTFYRGVFWHTVGYMKSRFYDAVVPVCLSDKSISLEGTPLQGADVLYSVKELESTVGKKFSGKLMCTKYYKDHDINLYASRRIKYRCFELKFKIYETAFQNAKQFYRECSSRRITDSAFDAYIVDNLICGCRVVSFGAEELLIPQMEPYRTEIGASVDDYPKVEGAKNIYSLKTEEEREETGIHAELTMEFSVPVHNILGTCFKCFVDCRDSDCPAYFLLALLEGDFTGLEPMDYEGDLPEEPDYWYGIYPDETYIDKKSKRLYFSVGLKNSDKDIKPDPSAEIGEYTDYIYPQ